VVMPTAKQNNFQKGEGEVPLNHACLIQDNRSSYACPGLNIGVGPFRPRVQKLCEKMVLQISPLSWPPRGPVCGSGDMGPHAYAQGGVGKGRLQQLIVVIDRRTVCYEIQIVLPQYSRRIETTEKPTSHLDNDCLKDA
jgi:hypothetical protein